MSTCKLFTPWNNDSKCVFFFLKPVGPDFISYIVARFFVRLSFHPFTLLAMTIIKCKWSNYLFELFQLHKTFSSVRDLFFISRNFGFGLASLLKKRKGRVRFSGPSDRELSYSGHPSFSLRSSFFISVGFAFVFAFFQFTSWSLKNWFWIYSSQT